MVIIGMVSFPLNSGTEAGQAFLKAPPLSDFITRRGPYLINIKGVGVESISIFEFDNSKMAEAMSSITNFYISLKDVTGFSYSTQVFMDIQESLAMIGLA